jgi:hypothetical protein
MEKVHNKFHENLTSHSQVIKFTQMDVTDDDIIRVVMSVRRGSWGMASLSSHLTNLSFHHVGISD